MKPSKPIRKGPGINVSPAGKSSGGSIPMPTTKSATPFGSVDKGVYKRTSASVTPTGVPVNDKDAGRGTGNVRSAKQNSNMPRLKSGIAAAE